ncbi:MAG: alpha/beta-hydrolase family protein, partial [Thermoleophilia bacterium]|nr:alpha/beta-hydrolase family protein [Thermoleophilia bacterium]
LLGRARGSAVSADAERAYLASTLEGSTLSPPAFDTAGFERISALRAKMTSVSGVTADTLLPDATLTEHGLKFINEVTPGAEIARVMGVDASKVQDPVRVYGGMYHGKAPEELAQKILDESIARGAFDKSRIVLYVPSGSGHVNPMPVAASEYETLGDIASVAMQYGKKPSVKSLDKVDDATALFQSVLDKFHAHIDAMPEAGRPKLTAYGESLGAWSVQDTWLQSGVEGLRSSGLDEVINVGSPRFSGFRSRAIGLAGHKLDPTGTIFEFNDINELRALDRSARDGVRGYLLTHYNDPVNKFSPAMFVQRPEWLSRSENAMGVPRKMKWLPGVSGLQGVMDTINGTNPNAGILARTGHDYRADMAPVMAEVLGTGTTESQLSRINGALTQLELARVNMPKPTPRLAVAA